MVSRWFTAALRLGVVGPALICPIDTTPRLCSPVRDGLARRGKVRISSINSVVRGSGTAQAVKLDAERLDAEWLDAERLDAERLDAERLDAERRTQNGWTQNSSPENTYRVVF